MKICLKIYQICNSFEVNNYSIVPGQVDEIASLGPQMSAGGTNLEKSRRTSINVAVSREERFLGERLCDVLDPGIRD